MVIEPAFGTFGSVGRCQVLLGKWNLYLHKACQQKEAWSALKFPGRWLRWLWTSENKVDQHQQMTWQPNHHWLWKLHTGLQATWNLCLSTLPPDSGTLISKWNAKFTFIWKEDFGPLSNSPVLFSTAQVRCFWRCLWFRSGLVALFLKRLSVVDSWCTDSSFSPLLVKLSQVLWISFAWLYSQACGHPCCLCTFSYPNSSFQSTLHLICFDTALCKQPHLSVMTFCDLQKMFIFWIIAKSAVFPIIVVSKNKRYPEFILYGWSFIETQM